MSRPLSIRCPACGSSQTRVTGGRAGVKWIGGTAWRLHYCLICDHRFPSIQRPPSEEDYIAADALTMADTPVRSNAG